MPFTFCHPAIVLPFNKIASNRISMTGLIAGSMSPDFEYFIRMQMIRTHGHELEAMIWFNLPICFALAFIYHGIVKIPLTTHLPHILSSRISVYNSMDWFKWFRSHWLAFIYSALIGIFSHIFWDTFTHAHGIFGENPHLLRSEIVIRGHDLFLFEILQLLSSVIGGLYILYFIFKMPVCISFRKPLMIKFIYWFVVFVTFSFILLVRDITDSTVFIATGISGVLIGIIISSILSPWYEKVFIRKSSKF